MAELLSRLGNRIRLLRVAYRLTRIFDSTFEPFRKSGSDLDDRLQGDELVIAYMLGVMTHLFDVYSTVGYSGRVLWKVYDRAFPGRGTEISELTVARVKNRNESFLRNVQIGSREARKYLASKGTSGLPTLTSYLDEKGRDQPRIPSPSG